MIGSRWRHRARTDLGATFTVHPNLGRLDNLEKHVYWAARELFAEAAGAPLWDDCDEARQIRSRVGWNRDGSGPDFDWNGKPLHEFADADQTRRQRNWERHQARVDQHHAEQLREQRIKRLVERRDELTARIDELERPAAVQPNATENAA